MEATKQGKWDHASGIRERLALLAHLGPELNEGNWGYHPSRDYWYSCGPEMDRRRINICQEGQESLYLIALRHGMDYAAAMARIGHEVRP